jgi:osmotically-inducible protein OsmY
MEGEVMQRSIAGLAALALSAVALGQNSPESSDDAALSAQVTQAVAHAAAADAKNINVQSREGTVQLSGFVKSDEARDAALQAAKQVPGVARVRNELTVENAESSPASGTSDTVIAAKVKSQLSSAGFPEDGAVKVEVQDGAVQLSGFVESVASKTRAADVASAVAGVTDVQNNIAVQETGSNPR